METIIPIIKDIILSTLLLQTLATKSVPSIVIFTLLAIDKVFTAGKNPSRKATLKAMEFNLIILYLILSPLLSLFIYIFFEQYFLINSFFLTHFFFSLLLSPTFSICSLISKL